MKLIIHGGFFSESSTSNETKIAKQEALEQIVKDSYDYLKSSAVKQLFCSFTF
jgi:L-asparaginase